MLHTLTAVYEHGILRPLEPLNLPDQTRVELTLQTDTSTDIQDEDAFELANREGDESIELHEVRQRLASIPGSLAESVISERGEY